MPDENPKKDIPSKSPADNQVDAKGLSEQANEIVKPKKPPKPEDKPFEIFIEEDLIPGLIKALKKSGMADSQITFQKSSRPVGGGDCFNVIGELPPGRRFWLSFTKNELTSSKTIALAETGADPTILESFLIDEKKATLSLLISRILQRLNGQKWLGPN